MTMRGMLAALALSAMASGAAAQAPATPPRAFDPAAVRNLAPADQYRPPEGIRFRADNFVSENVRLTAQWFYAAGNEGKTLPTVIIAHGWGGTAANFRADAVDLARAGYLVLLFDYRGWGDSDGRVVLTGAKPAGVASGTPMTAEVKELRGYIDPWEQVEDWFNAISYAVTQPMVDKDRIGIRGSSYSGGHVIYVAAHEPRVKALVSQVGSMDSRPAGPTAAQVLAGGNAQASALATGQAQYPPERARVIGNLIGAPVGNKASRWAPIEHAARVSQPALFVLAEKEELFSNTPNGVLACERVKGPRKMVMVPGITHYGIYGVERELAISSAIDWFDRYLKPAGAATRIPVDTKTPERGDCHAPFVRPAGVKAPAAPAAD